MKTEAESIEEVLQISQNDADLHPPLSFRPLHNQVVIRVLAEKQTVGSMVVRPDASQNRGHSAVGVVIAKGEGHRRRTLTERGPDPRKPLEGARYGWLPGYSPMEVKPGDYVLCARSMGEHHYIDGQSYLITPVEHIFAILDGYEASLEPATERQFGMDSYLDKKWDRPASARPIVSGRHA